MKYLLAKEEEKEMSEVEKQNDTGWEWNFSWRRLLFDNEIDTAISFLREVQGQSIQQQQIDIWEWIGDSSGIYTTRSAYNLIWEEIAGG